MRVRRSTVGSGAVVLVAVFAGLAVLAWRWNLSNSTSSGSAHPPQADRIVMERVLIEAFDEKSRRTTLLKGKTATTFREAPEVILEPVDGRILREGGSDILITALKVHKTVVRQRERLDFTGDVQVTADERRMRSQQLVYQPATRLLESPVPVQLITTGSVVMAQCLRSQTDLRTGTLERDVKIVSLGEGAKRMEAPMQINGDRCDFDVVRGLFDVTGKSWARHGALDVRARRISFNRRRSALVADGDVVAERPDLVVRCGHLEYFLRTEAGIATQAPLVIRAEPAGAHGSEARTEVGGQVLEIDFKKGIVEAEGQVAVERWVRSEGEWVKDCRITSLRATSLIDRRRTTFRDEVKIRTETLGAQGDRAIFYQDSSKLYIVGRAQAWDYDEEGQEKNRVAGEKIIHDMRTARSQVLDRVRSIFNEEAGPSPEASPAPRRSRGAQSGARSGASAAPPGRVEMIFREGDSP